MKRLLIAVGAGLVPVVILVALGAFVGGQFHDHDTGAIVAMVIGAVGGFAGVMAGTTVWDELGWR